MCCMSGVFWWVVCGWAFRASVFGSLWLGMFLREIFRRCVSFAIYNQLNDALDYTRIYTSRIPAI
jgi:hypothetical protein